DLASADVEVLTDVGLALVEVYRSFVTVPIRPRLVENADQAGSLRPVDDIESSTRRRAEVDLGSRVPPHRPVEGVVAQAKRAVLDESVGRLLDRLPEDVPVGES